MSKKGGTDYSLLIAALVAIVAIVGLIIWFNSSSSTGAANVILPKAAKTQVQPMYEEPALVGNKVAIQPEPMEMVEKVGKEAAYDSYLWCRDNGNWMTEKEKSQCCNMRCQTECEGTYGSDPYARDYQTQTKFKTCKETWCEDMCRRYLWEEYDQ